MRKGAAAPEITKHLAGYIRVAAATIEEAKSLLTTVEIRELPRT